MNEQPVNLNSIAWRDLFPWTIIFKTLPIAVSVAVLVWATVGVVLAPMGWIVSEKVFLSRDMKAEDPFLSELAEINRSPYRGVFRASESATNSIQVLGANFSGPRLVFENMIKPFRALFRSGWSTREYLYLIFGALWSLVVWSFVGLAVSRICVLRLTRDESLGIDDAFDFAAEKFKDSVAAVLMPLTGVAIICIPMAIIGLLLGFDFGVLLAGIFWFVVLAASAVIVFLLLGLMFGWPLIVSSVAAEGQNSFDAVTRAFAYTYQRPLNYAWYMLVAILFGGFCWLIVSNVTNSVVDLSYWSTSWGANRTGTDRIEVIKGVMDPVVGLTPESGQPVSPLPDLDVDDSTVSASLGRGRQIIGFWNGIARTLASAFIHGLFWCMATAIYLLLRRDVDETEMDEVYLVDEKRTYDLPPLKSDKHGIPQVQEPVARDSSEPEARDDAGGPDDETV